MPTQQQVQDLILNAQYSAALLTNANLEQLQIGNSAISWDEVRKLTRYANALSIQFESQNYTNWNIYNCLNDMVGFDTNSASIDPDFQLPSGNIIIVNPASNVVPIPSIPWSSFDQATQNPDGNRYIYYNANWKGLNPVLSLISPAETALTLGVDYSLIPTGGIQLLTDLSGAGTPGITDGQFLRAVSYALA